MIITLILFILILGITILVHEFGHFIFAKMAGVHIYEFALGFGPVIFKKVAKDGTQYAIRAIPLGGFVSMAGEEVDYDAKKHKGKNMQDKTFIQRFLIMFMGVGNNFIFAFLVLLLIGFIYGASNLNPIITGVSENYPAAVAGLDAGDKVLSINGNKVKYIDDISLYMTLADLKQPLLFEVEKENGVVEKYNILPEKQIIDGEENYVVGITLAKTSERGFFKSFEFAFKQEMAIFKQMIVVLKSLFTGDLAVNKLSGPVGIYSIVDQYKEQGLNSLLYLVALLSVNVGIINLIPLPAFDGGRILFLIIEKLKGSPINSKVENMIHSIGFILLMILMIYITFNDILNLF